MRKHKHLFFVLLAFILTSCSFNYSVGTDMKMKKKTIEGTEYIFTNFSKHKKIGFFFLKSNKFQNNVSFFGTGKTIHKTILKRDFDQKLKGKKSDLILIDSVSFSINEKKDNIDLIYYLNLINSRETVVFEMSKENDSWEIE